SVQLPNRTLKTIEELLMNAKLIVAISVLMVVPALAQAQRGSPSPNSSQPTKAEAQKVVQIISGDKVKTQHYCEMGNLNEQMAQAEQKNDTKTLEALGKRADDLAQQIGPEYIKLLEGLEQLDESSTEGRDIIAVLDPLDKL